ncbi:MAG: cytidine/deoxycytidylate deaminase family protein [Clostridia bacterium]
MATIGAKMSNFDKWDKRFMEMAETVAKWSSCYQEGRKIGAVAVREKRILTTGYNGAPEHIKSCVERCECIRRKNNIESGTRQEICYAVHAEQNAIIQAAKMGVMLEGATLYCTHQPCVICAKMIINAGIKRVVYKNGYPDEFAVLLFKEAGIILEVYDL